MNLNVAGAPIGLLAVVVALPLILLTVSFAVLALMAMLSPTRASRTHSLRILKAVIEYAHILVRR